MKRLAASLAIGSALASTAISCGKSDEGAAPPIEAGLDARFVTDAPPASDAAEQEVSLGDACGDRSGLSASASWPARGGCPKRAGYAAWSGPTGATIKWSVPLPAGDTSPVIDAYRVVWVGTKDGDIVGVHYSGAIIASIHTGGAIKSSAAMAASGATIIGSTDGVLYGAVRDAAPIPDAGADADAGGDAASPAPPGKIAFQRALTPMTSSPIIGWDETVYVGTSDGKLVALAPGLGAISWSATTNDTGGSSPAIGQGGTIYVGSSDKRLYAIMPDGSIAWSYETGGPITGSPAVGGDDAIYVGGSDGKLYALSPDGSLRWSYATGGPITGTPAVRAGTVYVGSEDKHLHAVSVRTGAGKWKYETLGAVAAPVVTKDGIVFAGSADGHLYAVTPVGLLYFAVNAKGAIRSAPALGDDGTLFVTTDHALLAIAP